MSAGTASFLRSRWLKPAAATAVSIALFVGYHVAGDLHRHGVVAAGVWTQVRHQGWANIVVQMTVVPESFNTTYLKEFGSLAGIHGKTANLLYVSRSGINNIAAQYWVAAIRPYGG